MKRRKITNPKEMYWHLLIIYYALLDLATLTTQAIMGNTTLLALILCITLPMLVAPLLPLLDSRYRKLKKKEE